MLIGASLSEPQSFVWCIELSAQMTDRLAGNHTSELLSTPACTLTSNCAHEAETANSQVLPCNTVPCFTVRVHIFVDCCNPERQGGLSVL